MAMVRMLNFLEFQSQQRLGKGEKEGQGAYFAVRRILVAISALLAMSRVLRCSMIIFITMFAVNEIFSSERGDRRHIMQLSGLNTWNYHGSHPAYLPS